MSGQVVNYLGALNSLTRQAIEHKTYDQFFNANPAFELLKSRMTKKRGGTFIQEQFSYGKSPNTQFYNAQSAGWVTAPYDSIATLGYNWVYTRDGLAVSGIELSENADSDEAICDIVQTRMDNMMLSTVDFTAQSLIINNPYGTNSDGTIGNPIAYEGLAVAVDDGTISNTVGGQSRTAFPVLKAQTNYNNTLSANLLASLQTLDAAANRGAQSRVNALLTTSIIYSYYAGLLNANERYTIDPRIVETNLGMKTSGQLNLGFNGSPIFYDTKVPTGVVSPATGTGSGGYIYGLNMDTFKFVVNESREFTVGPWYADQYGDNYFRNLFLAAAFICVQPNKNYVSFVSGG